MTVPVVFYDSESSNVLTKHFESAQTIRLASFVLFGWTIDYFTVLCLATWRLSGNEAGGDTNLSALVM